MGPTIFFTLTRGERLVKSSRDNKSDFEANPILKRIAKEQSEYVNRHPAGVLSNRKIACRVPAAGRQSRPLAAPPR
jgi:hypothetical protein